MEFLPFAFCESVCQTLGSVELRILRVNRAKFWKRAAAKTIDQRVNVALSISYGIPSSQVWQNDNKTWMYGLEVLDELNEVKQSITFAELQNLDRQHLQVKEVRLGMSALQTSSREEINEIVKFTLPFLSNTSLSISEELNSNEETCSLAISTFLALYQNVPISSLFCFNSSWPVEDFVIKKLEESTAPAFQLSLSALHWSADVRTAVEEFAISKPFASLAFDKAFMFSRAFFERLFEKPITRTEFQFDCHFSFDFTELQGFKAELQDAAEGARLSSEFTDVTGETVAYQTIVWRRIDGVQVTAICLDRDLWTIRWSRIQ